LSLSSEYNSMETSKKSVVDIDTNILIVLKH